MSSHTLSASRYMDLGDGCTSFSSEGSVRDLRFSSNSNGAKSITSVYRYIKKALNLREVIR